VRVAVRLEDQIPQVDGLAIRANHTARALIIGLPWSKRWWLHQVPIRPVDLHQHTVDLDERRLSWRFVEDDIDLNRRIRPDFSRRRTIRSQNGVSREVSPRRWPLFTKNHAETTIPAKLLWR
jgi:hypothetical protein